MFEGIFVFQPLPWEDRNWKSLSGLPLEDVWLPVDDAVTIFGWFLDAGPKQPVVLWCHGNAGNITHRLENMRALYRAGLSLFIFDYRGYGQSSGSPSEAGMFQDALTAYDYLLHQRKISADRIIVFGRSLGACVAGEVAIRRPVAGMILEGAFPSIQSMADHHYLGLPARWFVNITCDLAGKIAQFQKPLLMIHGERDAVVPMRLGREVFAAAQEPKQWHTVEGAGHNDVPFVGGQPYYQTILTFIRTVVPSFSQ